MRLERVRAAVDELDGVAVADLDGGVDVFAEAGGGGECGGKRRGWEDSRRDERGVNETSGDGMEREGPVDVHNRRRAHFMTKHVRPAVGGVAVENGDVGVAY